MSVDPTPHALNLIDQFSFKAVWTCIAACCSWLFTGFDMVLMSLLLLWAIDFGLGFHRAWKKKRLASDRMKKGVGKLLVYGLVLVCFVHIDRMVDYYFPYLDQFRINFMPIVALYLTINEALSILEHAALMGVRLPTRLTRRLRKMQRDIDKKLDC